MVRGRRERDALWNKKSGSLHKVKLILGIPTTPQDRRGFAAEEKAESALGYFARKRLITKYTRTVRYSPDDLDGKDFIVTLLDGRSIAIDVKNHHWSREKEQECRERGILLVTIWESDTYEIVREKMIVLIVSAYLSRLSLDEIRELIAGALRERIEQPKGLLERFHARLKKAGK